MSKMTYEKAVRLLVSIAKDLRRKRYAFDSSLYDKGLISERTKLAHKGYQEITEAIECIEAGPEHLQSGQKDTRPDEKT